MGIYSEAKQQNLHTNVSKVNRCTISEIKDFIGRFAAHFRLRKEEK